MCREADNPRLSNGLVNVGSPSYIPLRGLWTLIDLHITSRWGAFLPWDFTAKIPCDFFVQTDSKASWLKLRAVPNNSSDECTEASVRDVADAVLLRGQRGQRDEEAVEYIVSTDTLATVRSSTDYQYSLTPRKVMLKAKLTKSLLQDFTDRWRCVFLNSQLLLIILIIDSWNIYLFIYLFICGPFKQLVSNSKCTCRVYFMMISE